MNKKSTSNLSVNSKIRSKIINVEDFDEASDTQIAAEISIPEEGGWGWAVVAASFSSIFILDGIFFTFGTIYKDIVADLKTDVSLVTLINSVAIALYFIMGPVVSALINRFGFRTCSMIGSIIVSLSYFVSRFAHNYALLLVTYGVIPGLGGCFIYMSSQLVVGFYFERLRGLAMAFSGLGKSFGVMVMNTVNTQLVRKIGWRTTTLFHAGMFGIIYFLAMVYRPLLSLTVTNEENESDYESATYLPSLSAINMKEDAKDKQDATIGPVASERLFRSPSNIKFPTAADVIKENETENSDDSDAGPSNEPGSTYIVTARSPSGITTRGQLRTNIKDNQLEVTLRSIPEKSKWWSRLCHWRRHVDESRPMYRDDAFYNGRVQNLPAYQRSRGDLVPKKLADLKYRMAVSRTVTTGDLRESKGIYTTAVRRILATMMNPKLLRRASFLMLCTTGFFVNLGVLVPYIFLPDRNLSAGIDPYHCEKFVTVIGFSSAIGRLIVGVLTYKYKQSIRIYTVACLTGGIVVILTSVSHNIYFQYTCCVLFGISVSSISTLRSVVIVDLYGLENLTNATGIILLFQGFGTLLGTPLSSVIKNHFGYVVAFSIAGACIFAGGLILISIKRIANKEVDSEIVKPYVIGRRRSSINRNKLKLNYSSESLTTIEGDNKKRTNSR